MKKLEILDAISLIMAIALLLCLIDMPYGYYNFIRYATTILAIIWAVNLWNKTRAFAWISFAIAVIFNPFFKIALGRVLWNIADIGVAILLISVVAYRFKITYQSNPNQNDAPLVDDCADLDRITQPPLKSNHIPKRKIKLKTIVKFLVSLIIIAVISIGGYYYFKPDTPEVKADKILLSQKQQAQALEGDSLYYWCEKIIRKHDIPKCGNHELDENNKQALTELAWEKIKSLAFEGNYHAQFELGIFYDGYNFETGKWFTSKNSEGEYYNTNINLDKAAYWYLQAAKQGVSSAQHNLGICYFYGKGVNENKEEAIKWIRIAISNEEDYSEQMMGDLYRDGCKIYIGHHWEKIPNNWYYDWDNKIGYKKIDEYKTLIPQNIDSAIYYWRKAAAKGNETATERLQKIYESK